MVEPLTRITRIQYLAAPGLDELDKPSSLLSRHTDIPRGADNRPATSEALTISGKALR